MFPLSIFLYIHVLVFASEIETQQSKWANVNWANVNFFSSKSGGSKICVSATLKKSLERARNFLYATNLGLFLLANIGVADQLGLDAYDGTIFRTGYIVGETIQLVGSSFLAVSNYKILTGAVYTNKKELDSCDKDKIAEMKTKLLVPVGLAALISWPLTKIAVIIAVLIPNTFEYWPQKPKYLPIIQYTAGIANVLQLITVKAVLERLNKKNCENPMEC